MTRLDRKEIERMLAAGENPKPPAGLLEKLQAEIPEQYPLAAAKPRRVSSWRGWAAAASILAVVSMSYVMIRVVRSPEYQAEVSMAQRDADTPLAPVPEALEASPALERKKSGLEITGTVAAQSGREQPEAMKDSVALEQAAARGDQRGFMTKLPHATPLPRARREAASSADRLEEYEFSPQPAVASPPPPAAAATPQREVQGGVVGGVIGGVIGGVVSNDAAPPAEAARPRVAQEGMAKSALNAIEPAAGSTSGQFIDAEADPISSFGLRVGSGSWTLVRNALLDGRLPPPQSVRIDELINYFAYSDPEPTRGEVTVRTEGGESPSREDESEHLLRVGVRVSPSDEARVLNAKMRVEFDPAAVESYRLVGFENGRRSPGSPDGEDLPPGQRTTALYELRVRPQLPAAAQVGTVRLQYETSSAGRKLVEHVVRSSDLSNSWSETSKDLQLAAVVADWGELLRKRGPADSIAALQRRAEIVALKWPGNGRVAELLELIRATARILE